MRKEGYKANIIQKVIFVAGVCVLLLTVIFVVIIKLYNQKHERIVSNSSFGEIIVDINEISNNLNEDNEAASILLNKLIIKLQSKEEAVSKADIKFIIVLYAVCIFCILVVFSVVYVLVLRPFSKLEGYAGEIASGNLDAELRYNRVNMFGEFTWAFDHMRREIKKARACEQEAILNNKTVIATLSHDIKTPIASIRAYGEALADNMDSTTQRRNRYLDVIIKKCDEVTKITNDMFIHSLHDLDKLIIKKEKVDIHAVIADTVSSMAGGKADIKLGEIKEATLKEADAGRIAQVIENLINNSRKYAKTEIYINTKIIPSNDNNENISSGEYCIIIQDKGSGIPAEDMPFVFEKFYRGKNHGDEAGAGLGLFIVKYIMQQMDGKVNLFNEDGLRCELKFKIS